MGMGAGALAQVPSACPGPKMFEARFSRYDKERKMTVYGRIAYDAEEKRVREFEEADITGKKTVYERIAYDAEEERVREFEEADITGKKTVYDRLILHKQNIMYEINSDTKECNITTPPHAFMPIGVPPDAKYLGEGSIGPTGVANEHVSVAAFGAEFNGGDYMITVTYPDCYPVTRAFNGRDFHDMTMYYDEIQGIVDPDVFFPPKECQLPGR